jgi:cytochrome c biogenesis protein CcdA
MNVLWKIVRYVLGVLFGFNAITGFFAGLNRVFAEETRWLGVVVLILSVIFGALACLAWPGRTGIRGVDRLKGVSG